ncbi:Canalicular multispecific organic anion transporter 2 [Actinomortierella wolfii]|nr:Canalicular multispecific organic anion transporter 2 [Actinomortierella wolfii]
MVYLIAILIGFVVEAWPRGNTTIQRQAREQGKDTIRHQANLFSRATYTYLDPLMRLGYIRTLVADDVPNIASPNMLAEPTSNTIQAAWKKARENYKNKSKPPDMRWVIFRTIGWNGLPMFLYRLVGLSFGLAVPVLLKHFLRFLEQSSSEPDPALRPPIRLGALLAVGIFLSSVMASILQTACLHLAVEYGQIVRGGLIDMVYRKSLVLSPEARQAHTVGSIVNRMSVDCNKWAVLYSTIGWSIAAGVLVVLFLMPIQGRLGAKLNKSEAVKMTKMDDRVRMMSEILASIKVIKLYGWENPFRRKINDVRRDELQALKKLTFTRAIMDILFTSTTLLMALSTFTVYATIGGPGWTPGKMTADVVFVSITLFGMTSEPMDMISHCIASMISFKVSSHRIQDFLLSDEIDESAVQRYSRQTMEPNPVAVLLENATMSWSKKQETTDGHETEGSFADETVSLLGNTSESQRTKPGKPTLSHINLKFYEGTLTAVVGRVGQGKSSLLSAIIGEMYKLEGSISTYGAIAYVPQQAWIIHGTVRDNITFGRPFDSKKYDCIVHACGLLPDLAILPAGDQTEIGERGINLSGGQKQRVALARAAYQDADIYLLDDPLSAVDAHVDRHLWDHLLGPEGWLKDKTRILVTHGVHHLEEVDQVVILKNGMVDEVGPYAELLSHRKAFYQFIKEYRVEQKAERQRCLSSSPGQHSAVNAVKDDTASILSEDSEETEDTRLDNTAEVTEETNGKNSGVLTTEENVSESVAGWWIYKRYAKAASYRNVILVIVLFMAAQALHIATNVWLKYWIGNKKAGDKHDIDNNSRQHSTALYLGVYALLVVMYMVANGISNYVTPVVGSLRAAAMVHDGLLNRVLRLPMSFFDTTPQGRVLNRFSSDLAPIDSQLGENFVTFFTFTFNILGTIMVIAFSTPTFLLMVPPAVLTYVWIQRYYIQTSGSLKKLYQVTQSPLYSHFAETLAGVSTIRVVAGLREQFIAINAARADDMFQKNLTFSLTNRWLAVRLECLGALMIFIACLMALWRADKVDASMVGLALSYAVQITVMINYLVRNVSDIQNAMTNLERIYEYSEKPTEAPAETAQCLPEGWPQAGAIEFRNYSTRYRLGLDLVLRNISFEVQAGEKIGIVGRTGAGKSSLTLALFRIVEAANSYWARVSDPQMDRSSVMNQSAIFGLPSGNDEGDEGNMDGGAIVIDGVDISTLGLNDLRQHLSIIPQEPTLFAGTLRENLDPFQEKQDVDLWRALERAHLKSHFAALPGGLNFEVAQNGENFSVGQRSLLCLARALLRNSRILVLDEATSSVDMETDELIQQTIRSEFKDRTILTIAHRIKTVMDYDKILVLEKGRVCEYDAPKALLQNRDSLFYSLAKQAGEII